MMFILQHKLTQTAAQGLLQLLSAHFPPDPKSVTSYHQLKSLFKKKFQLMQHKKPLVCSVCEDLLPEDMTCCPRPQCQEKGLPPNEFLMFDLETSLAELFRGM